ncbi:MAG: replication-relaxation family protein [Deltaproteobacteria bacterium]|nr:replication-relaxation family protein [Deltaproteobacteria bacterium]
MTQPPLLAPDPPWLPELLGALAEHDCLAVHQLAPLLGRLPEDVAPILDRLARDRHVQVLEAAATRSKAYALNVRGARLLAELTGEEPVPVGRTRSTAILDHELVKNDLAVVLQLLDAMGRIELLRWETSRDVLADAVHVIRGKRTERVALVADGLAVIATPTGPTALLVEIDMGTVSLSRMTTKYAGYAAWWKAKGPERRFGLRSLRVLTIAKHEARMVRLRAAAAEAAGTEAHGLFWFATADVLDADAPEKLLAPRFWTAKPDMDSTSILPNVATPDGAPAA